MSQSTPSLSGVQLGADNALGLPTDEREDSPLFWSLKGDVAGFVRDFVSVNSVGNFEPLSWNVKSEGGDFSSVLE